MKGKTINYSWISTNHGIEQNDKATIMDVITVKGDTKYLIKTTFGIIKDIFPRQVTEVIN